ncbi:phosphoadenosine phosphosulfate reductase family protein [Vibrio parahaemolyticus]|nr:phosphoadenosine phosphosulfate reductase family protein [Vibrio parahaemolyticus]EIA9324816.1 phosphoadenosine phosphosulfate reductase family protein [Vibrio parahaemolyticus]EJG1681440.1 phosphoadenosine phosphosulfate reductase family protein [Vibrio parahaemolyticus]
MKDLFNLAKAIDSSEIIKTVNSEVLEHHYALYDQFEELVSGTMKTLNHASKPMYRSALSMGKDSFTTFAIIIEAYRRSIKLGLIERERPLLVNCVDTGVESLPMAMFSRYASEKLIAYAKKIGVNVLFKFVRPKLADEYFIRWASASKIIPSPTRSSDCTVILKVEPSNQYEKNIIENLQNERYKSSPIILALGSRKDESAKRSLNIKKRNLDNRYSELMHQLDQGESKLQVAPISDWSTKDVFSFLEICGRDPITRTKGTINTFLDNGAVLLEIYGDGSNDVCELITGSGRLGSSCGGKAARYGCFTCTLSKYDASARENIKRERWRVLGSENALRVRDYLFRIGHDGSKRAYMPKAYDPVCFNRVYMQPNCLKVAYLEKMVWYASQLAIDSENAAMDFRSYLERGDIENHPGYKEILEDITLSSKARAGMLEMYRSQAGKPLISSFSEKHALVLSFQWSLYGLAAAPYRPLAIWEKVKRGERIAYPKLFDEYESLHGAFEIDRDLPNVVMMKTMNEQMPLRDYFKMNVDLTECYPLPSHLLAIDEADRNCTMENSCDGVDAVAKVHCDFSINNDDLPLVHIFSVQTPEKVEQVKCHVDLSIDGLSVGGKARPELIKHVEKDIRDIVLNKISTELDAQEHEFIGKVYLNCREAIEEIEQALLSKSISTKVVTKIPNVSKQVVGQVGRVNEIKVKNKKGFTRRVVRLKASKSGRVLKGGKRFSVVHSNTRIKPYAIKQKSNMEERCLKDIELYGVEFGTEQLPLLDTKTTKTMFEFESDNLDVLIDELDLGLYQEQKKKMLDEHDFYLGQKVLYARRYKQSLRTSQSPLVAISLVNQGIIQLNDNYTSTFFKIVKRTHAFHEIGLLDLANCNLNVLINHPLATTASDFRTFKAQCLIELRTMINESRVKAKSYMNDLHEMNKESAVSLLDAYVKSQINNVMHSLEHSFVGRAKCAFIDEPITQTQKGRAYMSCALLNSHKDLTSALNSLIGRVQTNHLIENNELLAIATKVYERSDLTTLKVTLYHFKKLVGELMELQDELNCALDESQKQTALVSVKSRWQAIMDEYHPYKECYLGYSSINKQGYQYFKDALTSLIVNTQSDIEMAQEVEASLSNLINTALDIGVKKASAKSVLKLFSLAS